MRTQVVACWLYGGMRLPFAIGAVVLPFWGFQTPLSGQVSPVREVVPMGCFIARLSGHGKVAAIVILYQYDFVVWLNLYINVGGLPCLHPVSRFDCGSSV